MLLPTETLIGWVLSGLATALLVRRFPRRWLLWCGLGLIAAGAVYFPFVMLHRPPNYYAILEFLASCGAIGAGLLATAVGAIR
jgi:hypothetical protein